jgi:hypothetical protein
MMKKFALFFVGICGMAVMVSAQTVTNTRLLNENAARLKLTTLANFAKAMAMAKEKGWQVRTITKGGRVVQLIGVDEAGYPKYYITDNNTTAAATTRTSQLWPGGGTGLGLSGSSPNMKNKLAIWDGGNVLASHVELTTARITQKDNAAVDDHATHVAGTMMALGINPSAKGMAFGLLGMLAYNFEFDQSEMNLEAAAGLLLSNHSYSRIAGWYYDDGQARWEFRGRAGENEDYKFGYYSDEAANLDEIAYNAPNYLVVKSAGNVRVVNGPAVGQPYFRYNTSGTMASAGNRPSTLSSNEGYDVISMDVGSKNILTVGAVPALPTGYSRKEDVQLTTFSAWGPTDDGRIKPDIVADGVNLLSSIATSTTAYALYSGTSMAAPNTTGSLLLLQEYYSKIKSGAFMRSATLKGLAIHTAEESGAYDGPDYQFGWGLLNVEKAAAIITSAVVSNNALTSSGMLVETSIAQGASFSKTVVASGKGKLQATIVWTDVKGAVVAATDPLALNNRTKNLVNDLDIRITKAARTYFPWVLDVNNPSNPATHGDNVTDNVERIDIDSTVPGQSYVITVTHKGTLVKGPQAFSLIVTGIGGSTYCTSASGGGGARIDSVSFRNVQLKNSTGSKTYTDNTSYVANIEPGQTVPLVVRVNTADATTANRMVKVFMDLNNNGTFDLPAELVATSGVLTSVSQLYNASIVIPSSVGIGNIGIMRIIVQETGVATDINACGTYAKGETQDYTIRVVNPSNDMTINDLSAPVSSECGTPTQYLQVSLRNNGSVAQTNVPISITIATNGTVLGNYNFTHPGPISALSDVPYTFQTPVVTTGGTTYTITATVSAPSDQYSANNTLVTSVTTAAKPITVTGVASNCGLSVVYLKVTNPDADANYFWFGTASSSSPLTAGATASLSTRTSNNTYYVQRGIKATVGVANKQVYTAGGYNIFRGNYVKINNQVPLMIETARMYIGYPGTVKITLADLISEDASGSFSYLPLATNTIEVYATTPNVLPGVITGNNAADTGAIFRLDLPVFTTGDHILLIECSNSQGRADSATIFRNNGITSTTTYPMTIPNVFSITGNSAHTGGSVESAFYYFFYDMKVATFDCTSDRIQVTAVTPSVTITRVGNVLNGSTTAAVTVSQQWYSSGNIIANATSSSYTPTASGKYKLIVTDGFGCAISSAEFDYTITAAVDVVAREIKLNVSPNPNNGVFNLSFEVTTKADLSIEIIGATGKKVYTSSQPNFVGKYSRTITVQDLSSDFYILKIHHDKKTYVQKLLIQR